MVVTEEQVERAELIAKVIHLATTIRMVQEEEGGLSSVPIPTIPAERALILLVEELGMDVQLAADCTLLGHCSRQDQAVAGKVKREVFGGIDIEDDDPLRGGW